LFGLAQRYGRRVADGIVVAATTEYQSLQVSLDYLGESVTNPAAAARAMGRTSRRWKRSPASRSRATSR